MTTRIDLWTLLYQVAESQSGLFSKEQFLKLKFSESVLRRQIDDMLVLPITPGVFRLQLFPDSMRGYESYHTIALWSHNRAIFSHRTALFLHGLIDEEPDQIEFKYNVGAKDNKSEIEHIPHIIYPGREYRHNSCSVIKGLPVTAVSTTFQDIVIDRLPVDEWSDALMSVLHKADKSDLAGLLSAITCYANTTKPKITR